MKKLFLILPVIVFLGCIAAATWLMRPRQADVTQIIAQTTVQGHRFVLTQTYRGLFEGNEVEFFVEEKTGIWSWYYIEHEDTYWSNAELASVSEGIEVRRSGNVVAFYDLETNRYYLVGRGIWGTGEPSPSPLPLELK